MPALLDDPVEITRRDPHGAWETLERFASQCRDALRLRPDPDGALVRPDLVVIAGMGGSAASGDLLAGCLADRLPVPILSHRGYGLPTLVSPTTLVIASSYSGETVETVSALERAIKVGAQTWVVTSGGRLDELASRHRIPRIRLPRGFMPRMALGYLLLPLLKIVEAASLLAVADDELAEAVGLIEQMGVELAPTAPTSENQAKRLALDIGDRLPVLYGGPVTSGVAYRWKTDIEENAKRFAVAGALPEMTHNEIEAWQAPDAGRLHAIFLRDDTESSDIDRRFVVVRQLIEPAAGGVSEAWTRGRSRLARLLSLVCLGQWVSYYLALLRGVDPWPVPMLDEVKRRLRS
jgi:glucose/mannose-6-phosphate isomerase